MTDTNIKLAPFRGETAAVIGLARSGVACAEVLTRRGATVRVYDSSPEGSLRPEHVAAVRALGIEPVLGDAPIDYDGLDWVITSPGVRKTAPVLQNALAAGVPVIGEIEAAFRIARAPILAVTGTNGKTTTAVLCAEMLRTGGIETFLAGNIAAGDIAMPLVQAADLAAPTAAIVAEISSFQLEWIQQFRPKIAALLNITPDHADRQSWDDYQAAKWRIFENQTAADAAVVSGEYVYHSPFRERIATLAAPLWQFDIDGWQKRGAFERDGSLFLDTDPTGEAHAAVSLCAVSDVKLPGVHNLENLCAAACMAAAFGVGPDPIRTTMTTFRGVVHRLEHVRDLSGVTYINNSMCTNVAAFRRSLEAVPAPKVVITGGVFKGSESELVLIAQAIASQNVRALILIGRSAPQIASAARHAGYNTVTQAATLPDAVAAARAAARPGDAVMLAPACASFDMFRDFEDRGDQFKTLVHALTE